MAGKEEFTFDSRDGKTKIHAVRWVPEGKIVCILQIVHGMSEYIERYEALAQYFTERGILVTGEDHLGHGKSISEQGMPGYFCEQDPATVMVRDVHRLKKMTQEEYPGIPYVLLGHSMGSFITRNYLLRYGTGIQGAVICGTGYHSNATLRLCKLLVAIQGVFLGQRHVAKLLDRLVFGSYNKRIEVPRTQWDWLCRDEAVVDAYLRDSNCGFTFTVNGFQTLFELMLRQNREVELLQMPKRLPVLFIAGDGDPVGEYGEGVKKSAEMFEKAGMERVTLRLYPGGRHELLNETNRLQVYEELIPWLLERVREYQEG